MADNAQVAFRKLVALQKTILEDIVASAGRVASTLEKIRLPIALSRGEELEDDYLYPTSADVERSDDVARALHYTLGLITESPNIQLIAAGALLARVTDSVAVLQNSTADNDMRLALGLWSLSVGIAGIDENKVVDWDDEPVEDTSVEEFDDDLEEEPEAEPEEESEEEPEEESEETPTQSRPLSSLLKSVQLEEEKFPDSESEEEPAAEIKEEPAKVDEAPVAEQPRKHISDSPKISIEPILLNKDGPTPKWLNNDKEQS